MILKLFLSVCRGLFAMHTCPSGALAHRDIKVPVHFNLLKIVYLIMMSQPGNLLLSDDKEELVLMDLGSATPGEVSITNRLVWLPINEYHYIM